MIVLAIIVLAIILAILLFRPRPTRRARLRQRRVDDGPGLVPLPGDYGDVVETSDDSARFEAGGGDFGGAGASESWDADDSDGDDDGGDGD